MLAQFRAEQEPLGSLTYLVKNKDQAVETVLNILREAGGQEILAWDDGELPVRGIGEALRANGYVRMDIHIPSDAEGRRSRLMKLERAAAGLTGATAGLADTGSLVLVTSPARPRLVSLLPPVHLALLSVSRLLPTMAAFWQVYPDLTGAASNLVFVTGPSRTADIELTLTRGVHGPKQLHIILLDYELP
jgi:L-lactate dehydrogenase complex protein LldG